MRLCGRVELEPSGGQEYRPVRSEYVRFAGMTYRGLEQR